MAYSATDISISLSGTVSIVSMCLYILWLLETEHQKYIWSVLGTFHVKSCQQNYISFETDLHGLHNSNMLPQIITFETIPVFQAQENIKVTVTYQTNIRQKEKAF